MAFDDGGAYMLSLDELVTIGLKQITTLLSRCPDHLRIVTSLI